MNWHEHRERRAWMATWVIANFIAVGLFAFSGNILLRVIGWIWISIALSLAGLVEIGSIISSTRSSKEKNDKPL